MPVHDRNTRFRITIEPVGFLLVTAGVIQVIDHQNLYINKVCRVNFQLNVTSCTITNVNNESGQELNTILQDQIQASVSALLMWASLIESLPSILFVLFLGPWSNKHGRKPLMILPIIGYILSILINMAVKSVDSLKAEYLLFGSLPIGLLGGMNTLMMATNSYLADITTEDTRTSRLSFFSGMIMSSIPVANYASVYILDYGGEWAIWSTSLGLAIFALFYLVFFVTDSRGCRKSQNSDLSREEPIKGKVQQLRMPTFVGDCCLPHLKTLLHCFAVTFKSRVGYRRTRLGLMLIMTCLMFFSFAPGSMGYLYTRKQFSWDASDFALYGVVVSVVPVTGNLLVLPLLSGYFKIDDWVIGVASLLGNIGAMLIIAFATYPLMMYLSSIGTILTAGIGIVINSAISKIVGMDDLVYVYSVTACLSSVMPMIASTAVNLIYIATLKFFPGCVFIFGACIDSAMLIISIMALIFEKRDHINTIPKDPVTGISFKFRDSFKNGNPDEKK